MKDPRFKKLTPIERIIGVGITGTARRVEKVQRSNFGGFRQNPRK